ncbi:hypothetical protein ABT142_23800 [Streptomyces sp. NPDC001857]|uniref:hypothetical protein n=1 Tax=unclassified Streptomyces TaxID=2593676 RepID=UPI0033238A18
MGRGDLTDEQWAVLVPLLPKSARTGRPPRLASAAADRRHVTRYEKLAVRYEATVLVAAINEWL